MCVLHRLASGDAIPVDSVDFCYTVIGYGDITLRYISDLVEQKNRGPLKWYVPPRLAIPRTLRCEAYLNAVSWWCPHCPVVHDIYIWTHEVECTRAYIFHSPAEPETSSNTKRFWGKWLLTKIRGPVSRLGLDNPNFVAIATKFNHFSEYIRFGRFTKVRPDAHFHYVNPEVW